MIAVIFEVWPANKQKDTYLDLAAVLREELTKIDGFISIERFQSLTEEGKILSLSFWRDEKAIHAWRTLEKHRNAQSQGRNGVFDNYRLRVAPVARDYSMNERAEAPSDSQERHGNSD